MAKTKEAPVVLPTLDRKTIEIQLVGDSPLVVHRFGEKARKQMRDKQTKRASAGREAKDPHADYLASMYWLDKQGSLYEGEINDTTVKKLRPGFPTIGFKACAVTACTSLGKQFTKVAARQAFHLEGEYTAIEGEPRMREDVVRVGMGTADLRYRAEFMPWSVRLKLTVNASAMSIEQCISLFQLGGFAVGVGEYRPEKDGSWGRFHVA